MPPVTQLSTPAMWDPSSRVRLAKAPHDGPWLAPSVLAYCQIIASISAGLRVWARRWKWRAMCTMAARSMPSLPGAGVFARSRASSVTGGMPAGEVRSAAAFGTKEIPVAMLPAPMVISAVACCQCGLGEGGTTGHLQNGVTSAVGTGQVGKWLGRQLRGLQGSEDRPDARIARVRRVLEQDRGVLSGTGRCPYHPLLEYVRHQVAKPGRG